MCTRIHVQRKSVVYYQYDIYLELFFPKQSYSNDDWHVLGHPEHLLDPRFYS